MDALHPHLSSGHDSVSKLKMATKCTAKASGKVSDPSVTLFSDWEYQQGNLQTVNSFPIPATRCISLLAKSDAMRCQADGGGDADADTFGCVANGAQGCEACPPVGVLFKQLAMAS